MSRELIETLRDYADKAEAGDKLHWADAMRRAAEYIRVDLDKPLPEPAGWVFGDEFYFSDGDCLLKWKENNE